MWYQPITTEGVWVDTGISITIFFLFLLFRKIFAKYVFKFILAISKKTPTELLSHILLAFEKPIRWLFISLGIYVSVKYFPFIDHTNQLFMKLIRSSVILLLAWGFYNLSAQSSILFTKINDQFNVQIDQILIPFLSKAIRFVIVAISFSIIAQEFEYDVNGFVAGLGLGGLAFALAAKDALSNLFGGIVIITEKPFNIGDWVKTKDVEGVVEDISFRSTRIRTFAQALVTVPNSTLANQAITNWSQMGKRQITFNLGITYDTPKHKVEEVIQQIEHMLIDHPDIHEETIFVKFDRFNESSLDIFLYFFTKTTVWGEFLSVKQDINLRIMQILEEEGVSIAFPSRTLYLSSEKEYLSE